MIKLPVPASTDWTDSLRMYGEIWMYLHNNLSKCSKAVQNSNKSHVFMRSSVKGKSWTVTRYRSN